MGTKESRLGDFFELDFRFAARLSDGLRCQGNNYFSRPPHVTIRCGFMGTNYGARVMDGPIREPPPGDLRRSASNYGEKTEKLPGLILLKIGCRRDKTRPP